MKQALEKGLAMTKIKIFPPSPREDNLRDKNLPDFSRVLIGNSQKM